MRLKKYDESGIAIFWQSSELKKRLLFTLIMLLLFRLGAWVPIPGTAPDLLASNPLLAGNLVAMYDLFARGTLKSLSVFALGIGPYISASIVVQLMTAVHPYLKAQREEGEHGQRQIRRIIRWLTLFLAACESFGLARMVIAAEPSSIIPLHLLFVVIMITVTAATMIIMWMSELISEKGIGNGSSLLICTGIIVRIPSMIQETWISVDAKQTSVWGVMLMVSALTLSAGLAIALQQGMKKLTVLGGRAKLSKGLSIGATQLYLPMNPAGVMPIVFASQAMFFISMLVSFCVTQIERLNQFLLSDKYLAPFWSTLCNDGSLHTAFSMLWAEFSYSFNSAHWEYYVAYTILILFFSHFYSDIMLPSKDIAESLRKSNRVIAGVRPGRPTVVFLRKTIQQLALVGAAAVAFIALLPTQIAQLTQVQSMLGFGSTSLIILTGVALDTQRQITAFAASSRTHKRHLLPPAKKENESTNT